MALKSLPIAGLHPFLFTALPVILLLTYVKDEILPEETLPALIGLELTALVIVLIGRLIYKNFAKAFVAATLFMVCIFTYRVWQVGLSTASPLIEKNPWIALLSFFVLIVFLIGVFMRGQFTLFGRTVEFDFKSMNSSLSVVSAILVVLNLVPLISYEVEQNQLVEKVHHQWLDPEMANVKLDQSAPKPNVYYIILDGFAAPYTLEQFWGFKSPAFAEYLSKSGFYVVPKGLSNYDRTEFSICSSLNMNYINDISPMIGGKPFSLLLMRLLQKSASFELFKKLGYRFVSVSSGSFGTDRILTADKIIAASNVNHFFRAMAYMTPWWSLEHYFPLLRDAYGDTRLTAGTHMAEILAEKGPKFVFIHTDLPHAPYLFDKTGKRLALPPGLIPDWEPPAAYYEQWQFCCTEVSRWIEQIDRAENGKAVIIVQSDHGSGLKMKKVDDWYNERMRIMNAYLLPEGKSGSPSAAGSDSNSPAAATTIPDSQPYDTITPVNSFRVVFNKYFKANLKLLPDRSYCAPVWEKPLEWQEITAKVKWPQQPLPLNRPLREPVE